MSPDSLDQFVYRIIANRRECARLGVAGGKYYSEGGGPDEVEFAMVDKALRLASWRRNVFITIEARCNVIGLVRVEPLHSFQNPPPICQVGAMSRLLVPLARGAHRQFVERQVRL
jgi:hypothetical protein